MVEFHLAFCPLVKKYLVQCLNFAHRHGEKNWRPILLINVDVKIVSKVMAMRLESILPILVHHSHNAFIKLRKVNI